MGIVTIMKWLVVKLLVFLYLLPKGSTLNNYPFPDAAKCQSGEYLLYDTRRNCVNNTADTNYFNYSDAALSMGLDSAQEQSLISKYVPHIKPLTNRPFDWATFRAWSWQSFCSRPPSFAPLNITMASSNYDAQIEKPDLPAVPIKLRCQFPDCSEDRVFPTEAALR